MHRSGDWTAYGDVRYRIERSVDVAGRRWTAAYIAGPGLEATSGRWLVGVVAVGGLFATVLLLLAAWFQARARAEAERASAAELLRHRNSRSSTPSARRSRPNSTSTGWSSR